MQLSFPLKQRLVSGRGNTPDVEFPGGTADRITIHMTGNRSPGANAAAHANWMATNAPYSWHVTVDDVEAWQSIAWNLQGWHAGDGNGPGNRESIGVEICMHKGINQIRAYEHAAELVAWLRRMGHGSAGIVQHAFWTGKNCPELIRAEPGRWEWFLVRVEQYQATGGQPMAVDEAERLFNLMNAALQRRMALRRLADHPESWKIDRAIKLLTDAGLLDYTEFLPKS
jgi:N-acetylmuramoyl-L-alanine amidase